MPDYLGDAQRKVNKDEEEEKIKGKWYPSPKKSENLLLCPFLPPTALDEGDIQIIKTYVSPVVMVGRGGWGAGPKQLTII